MKHRLLYTSPPPVRGSASRGSPIKCSSAKWRTLHHCVWSCSVYTNKHTSTHTHTHTHTPYPTQSPPSGLNLINPTSHHARRWRRRYVMTWCVTSLTQHTQHTHTHTHNTHSDWQCDKRWVCERIPANTHLQGVGGAIHDVCLVVSLAAGGMPTDN